MMKQRKKKSGLVENPRLDSSYMLLGMRGTDISRLTLAFWLLLRGMALLVLKETLFVILSRAMGVRPLLLITLPLMLMVLLREVVKVRRGMAEEKQLEGRGLTEEGLSIFWKRGPNF